MKQNRHNPANTSGKICSLPIPQCFLVDVVSHNVGNPHSLRLRFSSLSSLSDDNF